MGMNVDQGKIDHVSQGFFDSLKVTIEKITGEHRGGGE
jgi:hypothetical protein